MQRIALIRRAGCCSAQLEAGAQCRLVDSSRLVAPFVHPALCHELAQRRHASRPRLASAVSPHAHQCLGDAKTPGNLALRESPRGQPAQKPYLFHFLWHRLNNTQSHHRSAPKPICSKFRSLRNDTSTASVASAVGILSTPRIAGGGPIRGTIECRYPY